MSPGSPEAAANGCTCPTMDNANGAGVPGADGKTFWIDQDCPLHGLKNRPLRVNSSYIPDRVDESDNIKDIFSKT